MDKSEPRLDRASSIDLAARGSETLSRYGLIVLLSGFAMTIADTFIVNVALDTIKVSLGASPAMLSLVVAGYGVSYSLGLVLAGRFGDSFGRARLFVIGVAGFTLASVVCGLAGSPLILVGARIIQGLAAALMVPQVLGTVQATTEGDRKTRAIALYGSAAGIAAVAGQIIGGLLLEADLFGTSWRMLFLINVPIGIWILLSSRSVPESRSPQPLGIDTVGTVTFAVALASLLLVIVGGPPLGWPWWLLIALAVSMLLAAALYIYEHSLERSGKAPLLPPAVLSIPSVHRGLASMVVFSLGFGGFLYVYAIVTQQMLGFSGLKSGLILVPFASAFFLVSLATQKIVKVLGVRIITVGAAIQGLGITLLAVTFADQWGDPSIVVLVLILGLIGVGQGLIGPTLFRVILSRVPIASAGMASGVVVTSQQAATAVGAAGGGALIAVLGSHFSGGAIAAACFAALAGVSVLTLLSSLALPQLDK